MHTYSYSQIWKIAFPVLISTLMEQLIGMTDTAFLGRIGEVELGASALGGIFFVTIFMLGLGFSIGAQILMGRRNGEGNYLQIGNIFYHSLAFLLCMALVLFVLTRYASPVLLEGIISSHRVCEATNSYLHWRIYGFFFAFVNVMFSLKKELEIAKVICKSPVLVPKTAQKSSLSKIEETTRM